MAVLRDDIDTGWVMVIGEWRDHWLTVQRVDKLHSGNFAWLILIKACKH
jgi:hypothetical protein